MRWDRMAGCRRSLLLLFAVLLVAFGAPRRALAWVDLTVARDDIRITIDEAGQGIVEHAILILVSGGPLTELTIAGVDADAELLDGAHLVRDAGAAGARKGAEEDELPISAKRVETKTGTSDLVVSIDEGRGVRRGRYWVHLSYRTNLHASSLRVEGPRALLDWSGPTWDYGLETTRATFVLPASRTEPSVNESVDAAGSFIPTVRSLGRQAELTLVRPYAAKGERVVWPVAFDARVLARSADASKDVAAPVSSSSAKKTEVRQARWEFAAGSLAAFVLTFALVWAHGREADARARSRGSRAAPLVPWPSPVRALLAALLFAGGAWLTFCEASPVYGALAMISCVVFILHRNAVSPRALRKPGAWLFVRKEEAFLGAQEAPRELFDLRARASKIVFALLLALFGSTACALSRESIELAVTTALAVAPLCVLFATGDRRHQRPDLTYDVLPTFQRVIARVEKKLGGGVRVATRLRMPEGSQDADELRVVFMPDRAERGLRSIELAMEPHPSALGTHLRPVLLVRFEADSPALERAKKASYASKIVTGRSPTERVVVLSPKLPSVRVTTELVLAVVNAMTAARPAQPAAPSQPAAAVQPAKRKPPVKAQQPVKAEQPVDDFEETRSIPVPKKPVSA